MILFVYGQSLVDKFKCLLAEVTDTSSLTIDAEN